MSELEVLNFVQIVQGFSCKSFNEYNVMCRYKRLVLEVNVEQFAVEFCMSRLYYPYMESLIIIELKLSDVNSVCE